MCPRPRHQRISLSWHPVVAFMHLARLVECFFIYQTWSMLFIHLAVLFVGNHSHEITVYPRKHGLGMSWRVASGHFPFLFFLLVWFLAKYSLRTGVGRYNAIKLALRSKSYEDIAVKYSLPSFPHRSCAGVCWSAENANSVPSIFLLNFFPHFGCQHLRRKIDIFHLRTLKIDTYPVCGICRTVHGIAKMMK